MNDFVGCNIKQKLKANIGNCKQIKCYLPRKCIGRYIFTVHQRVFEAFLCYLEEILVKKKKILLLREINDYYCCLVVREFVGCDFDCVLYTEACRKIITIKKK